jgi:polygalacturonase
MIALAVSARAGTPPLPVISNQVFVVTNTVFAGGAYGNGSSNSTAAINAAITYAAGHGGGTVEIPPVGTLTNYLSGPITMASHVNLQVDGGAKLQMFPMSSWVSNYGSSTPFVSGSSLTDAEISGSGIIDGQGTNWWSPLASTRPHFIDIGGCTRVLIQNVTLQNPPTFHIYMKSSDTSVTVQGITINTPFDSHNTDGFDITSTNVLIQNCSISTGDDDNEVGGSAAATDITVSNCTFGTGHGVSIGSYTQGGVNNLIVSNCSWNGTEYGLKIKTDRDRGGVMQNLKYCDLTMTNVNFPIAFYMDYDTLGSPSKSITVTPANAAADTTDSITSTTPYFRNITISNLTAVGNSGIQGPGNIAGIIYGVPESPVTNVTLSKVNILGRSSGQGTFCIYHARGIKIIDSNLTAPTSGTNTLTLYNAEVSVTNSAANPTVMTITGLGAPSNSVLSLFNGQASTADASVLGGNPVLTLAGGTLAVNNSMSVGTSSRLNYGLGTNATDTAVTGNLTLGGTLNVADGGGFTTRTYSLFTYGGTLSYNGLTVGSTPNPSFTYTVSTNTHGQVNLVVASSCSVGAAGTISGSTSVAAGTNGVTYSISSVSGATTYAWTVPTGASVASGQGTTSIMVNYSCTAASGNVTVTPSNGSCSGTPSSMAVAVTGVGAAGSISGLSTVCAGQTGVIYSISGVSGAMTYTWTVPTGGSIANGQGTTSITVNYSGSAVSGSVMVTPSNGGCNGGSSSLPVTVNPMPSCTVVPPSAAICAGGSQTFTVNPSGGTPGYTYLWSDGTTGTSITTNGAGTYSVTVTDSKGCTTSCGATLTVNPTPTAPTAANNGPIVEGDTLNLTASTIAGVTYNWTGPNSFASTNQNPSISNATSAAGGTYLVTVTDSNGCTSAAGPTIALVTALRITAITGQGNDIQIMWLTTGGTTNAVQMTAGAPAYNTNFVDVSGPLLILGSGDTSTNYVDGGGATNVPSRFYRVRLVP